MIDTVGELVEALGQDPWSEGDDIVAKTPHGSFTFSLVGLELERLDDGTLRTVLRLQEVKPQW